MRKTASYTFVSVPAEVDHGFTVSAELPVCACGFTPSLPFFAHRGSRVGPRPTPQAGTPRAAGLTLVVELWFEPSPESLVTHDRTPAPRPRHVVRPWGRSLWYLEPLEPAADRRGPRAAMPASVSWSSGCSVCLRWSVQRADGKVPGMKIKGMYVTHSFSRK